MSLLSQAEFKIVCGVRYNRFYVIKLLSIYIFKTLEISVGCCTCMTITFLLKLFYWFIILVSLTVQNPASSKEDLFNSPDLP